MKTSRFSDSQILAILKEAEAGMPVPGLCRHQGISSATFYKWRVKFGGMDASLMARLKDRLLNVIDDFNREGLCIDVDFSLPSERVIRELNRIIEWRGAPIFRVTATK